MEAPEKGAAEAKPVETPEKGAAEAKPASAKEVCLKSKAKALSEKEKTAEAKAAPEKGAAAAAKKVLGPSEKEKAAEDKAASAKEASAEAKGSSEKDGPARKEQPSRPEATYKEVLVGWQLLEKQASAKEEWALVESKRKSCKKDTNEPLEKKRQSPGNSQQQKEKQNLAMFHWAAAAIAPARAQPHRHPLKKAGPQRAFAKKGKGPCGHRLAWGFSDQRVGSGQGT